MDPLTFNLGVLTCAAIALGAALASLFWRRVRDQDALRWREFCQEEGERQFCNGMRWGHAAARAGRSLPSPKGAA